MAVYTKINNKQIKFIERKYNIGKIENYSGIKKLNLNPLPNKESGLEGGWSWTPFANQKAIEEIMIADYIVIGPGSLFTSIIPNFLVPEIVEAIEKSNAPKLYICNLMTQPGETDGLDVSGHIKAIEDQLLENGMNNKIFNRLDLSQYCYLLI